MKSPCEGLLSRSQLADLQGEKRERIHLLINMNHAAKCKAGSVAMAGNSLSFPSSS